MRPASSSRVSSTRARHRRDPIAIRSDRMTTEACMPLATTTYVQRGRPGIATERPSPPPPESEHDLCPVSPLGVCSHFARFDKISVLSQIALKLLPRRLVRPSIEV